MTLASGIRLGPYEILSALGSGGMGEVYKARDVRLDRAVAIKVLPERWADDASALLRFEREAKAIAALSHPNIVAIFDVGADRGVSYVVTELLEGETLRVRLRQGALPWRKAAGIGAALAQGLAAAHAKGIIHRDLKPENVILTADGRVKILDFGLARVQGGGVSCAETMHAAESAVGTILGTIGYLSPEQIQGGVAEASSDLFSLGCVLYEMVSGEYAFLRPSAAETLAAVVNRDPPPLTTPGVAPAFEQVLRRCLEKDPFARFQSATDLAFCLSEMLNDSEAGHVAGLSRRTRPLDSLAVLPFANGSGDPDAEYFSEGITESIINNLSRLDRLRVIARSTVFRYKGQEADLVRVARELDVRAILTGRVVLRGDTIRIQAELVNATDGSQLWGQRYHRKAADIFSIEEEMATEISDALQLRLSRDEQKQLGKRHTASNEAYQLYLKGRYYWNRRGEDTLKRAVPCFEQAVALDPGFALAWSAMADCYTLYGTYSVQSPREALPRAREAARKALEIDGTLAEAHASMGVATAYGEFDWNGAQRALQHALSLSPNSSTVHNWVTMHLLPTGLVEQAIVHAQRAIEIEPLSLGGHICLGASLTSAGRDAEAADVYRRVIELDPSFAMAHRALAFSHERLGQPLAAVAELEQTQQLLGDKPLIRAALGRAYAIVGRRDEAQTILHELAEQSTRRYIPPFDLALICLGLSERDQAMDWLEKACEDRSFWFIYSIRFPVFAPIRGEARFRTLLRRMNLAE